MPLKSTIRVQTPPSHLASSDPRVPAIPSIRLISATPSAHGLSSTEGSTSMRVFDDSMATNATPWESQPPPPPPPVPKLKHSTSRLLPKRSNNGLRNENNPPSSTTTKRLIPKKSKLGLLSSKETARSKDLSDVVRRVTATNGSQASLVGSSKLKGGFEIYVDPSVDSELGDILVVKKQKSRAALDDMGWGPAAANANAPASKGVLGEVTNTSKNSSGKKEKEKEKDGGLLKVKVDEERKWWSIGRGRKDSKEEKKNKEKENAASKSRASSPVPPPRSKTPEPFKMSNAQPEQTRTRFNSLDAGILLGLSKKKSNDVLSSAPTVRLTEAPVAPAPTVRLADAEATRIKHLSNPQLHPQTQPKKMERIPTPPQVTYSRSASATLGGLLAPPTTNGNGGLAPPTNNAANQGSIALRAMRSVKSLARIGSWAQFSKDAPADEKEVPTGTVRGSKDKSKEKKEEKRKSKKSKNDGTIKRKEKDTKEKDGTVRMSTSSFEAGALSSSPPPAPAPKASTVSKKHSILGLGLPSSMRLPAMRSGSTASSILAPGSPTLPIPAPQNHFGTVGSSFSAFSNASSNTAVSQTAAAAPTVTPNRLSVDSGPRMDRRASIQSSTGSSLRPVSITSTISGGSIASKGSSARMSSGSSVRWDEEGLERAKAERDITRRNSKDGKRTSKDSKRSSGEGRRRTAITDIFPEIVGAGIGVKPVSPEPEVRRYPIVTIEEATADGHGEDLDDPIDESEGEGEEEKSEEMAAAATPVKKPRARPLSEQLLGRSRPAPMHEDDDGVLDILSAATNDLAQLIDNLNLEATPTTPDVTPLKPCSSPFSSEPSTSVSRSMSLEYSGSPLKKKTLNTGSPAARGVTVRSSVTSISSLRPYAQSRVVPNAGHPTIRGKPSNSDLFSGKAIPSWPLPEKASLASLRAGLRSAKGSEAPALEELAKKEQKEKEKMSTFVRGHRRTLSPVAPEPEPAPMFQPLRPPKPRQPATLKSKLSPARVRDAFDDSDADEDRVEGLNVGKRASENTFGSFGGSKTSVQSKGSKESKRSSTSSRKQRLSTDGERRVPLSREARRLLGMSGTMGGSDVSAYQVEIDESDPDSDVPEELRFILRKEDGDTISYQGVSMEEDDEGSDGDDSSFTGRHHFEEEQDVTMDMDLPRSVSVSPLPPLGFSTSSQVSNVEIQTAQRLPVFRAQLVTDTSAQDADIEDDAMTSSDENTKQSFDFTGELAKLNESGASDRRSFVEQLENAFKTPAKVDLRADFGINLDVPPVPALPPPKTFNSSVSSRSQDSGSFESSLGVGRDIMEADSQIVEMEPTTFFQDSQSGQTSDIQAMSQFNDESVSHIMEMRQPSLEIPSLGSSHSSNNLKLKSSVSSAFSKKSDTSDGVLNRSFRFGGLSSASPSPAKLPESPEMDTLDVLTTADLMKPEPAPVKPLTLADVIPPPSHVREISFSSSMLDDYEDSALKSILAGAIEVPQQQEQQRYSTASSTQDHRMSRTLSTFIPLTRPSSGVSFAGLDSFDEVRRGFEFNDQRPNFYPGPAQQAGARNRSHRRAQDSVFSIASVSSYGRVIRDGATDPFDYGMAPPVPPLPQMPMPPMPSLRERSFEEDLSDSMSFDMSTQVDDTFSFIHHRPVLRRRVDSDASSFYFNPAPPAPRGHRRRESNMSVSSITGAPPVSMYNRSYGHHRRNSSTTSASSVALSYAMHGAMGGRAILARHRRDTSIDSVSSEFASMRTMARPGLGDKMFDNEYAAPLAAIAGSPSGSISGRDLLSADYGNNRTSSSSFDYYDSIIDGDDAYRFHPHRDSIAEEEDYDEDERRSSMSDSLFDETGEKPSSVSSGSVFGDDDSHPDHGGLLPPHQFRPLSVISLGSAHSSMKEDDTMISMIGGGHVRRQSVGSMIEASPCVRMDKKRNHRRTARMIFQGIQQAKTDIQPIELPSKNKTIELKPSIASTSSYQFGGERMIQARHGLLERQSLEESVLIAEGEDMSLSFHVPVFTRPQPTSRSRSSTCTSASESSGRDTPPLSPSDGSSISGGSFSSIDMADMSMMLSNTTHPVSTLASARARARDHGHGHRRRYSKAHVSRSSVYETIEEEMSSAPSSPAQSLPGSATKKLNASIEDSTACQGVVYVVGSDTESIQDPEESIWDDERGIVALRKYYTLKDEVQETVQESQRTWMDTPWSIYTLQSFDPPRHPDGMRALLEDSRLTYQPLPAELRRMRSRKDSRPSPYPQARIIASAASPARPPKAKSSTQSQASAATPVLKDKTLNANISLNVAPALETMKPASPFVLNITDHSVKMPAPPANKGSTGPVRPRVPSAARRSALGWSKRGNGAKTSTDKKENAVGEGSMMTPGESLRLSRPRPRSRTPASQARPIRV